MMMMMHRASSSRIWLRSAFHIAERPRGLDLPVFLCPLPGRVPITSSKSYTPSRLLSKFHCASASASASTKPRNQPPQRRIHISADQTTTVTPPVEPAGADFTTLNALPRQCTGCGALSQTVLPNQPGYFGLDRKAVRKYIGVEVGPAQEPASTVEEDIVQDVMSKVDQAELERQGVDFDELSSALMQSDPPRTSKPVKPPLCDRCHTLLHNRAGTPIMHPTIDSIHDTLLDSPYKYNHIYHVLDAADFPMSLMPKIRDLLELMPLRTRNRRSNPGRYQHGQKMEMSFVITRADLLAPTKQQADRLLPYLREVLRDALGRDGRDIRLGNISLVSAVRGWWTKEVKDDIWQRGGAAWLVGKANVGKSQLFESVFPKGRMEWAPTKHQIAVDLYPVGKKESLIKPSKQAGGREDPAIEQLKQQLEELEKQDVDSESMLTPAPPEVQFPEMPLVSDLPGTTASPIRVPYGNGRGEVIDLPGLERSTLDQHVREEFRPTLVMRSRVVPEQIVLKPGQSLILGGGLIRITPREPAPIMQAYSFTPIEPHLTATEKAIGLQAQTSEVRVDSIAVEGTGDKVKLAKTVELRWDVTKEKTGPLTRKNAIGLSVDRLPYRVVGADILIDGVGWIEVTAQVRTRNLYQQVVPPKNDSQSASPAEPEAGPEPEQQPSALERLEGLNKPAPKPKKQIRPISQPTSEPVWPVVEVFSPEGKYIAVRRPMNGWEVNKPKHNPASAKSRPRKSMKGAKRLEKQRRRQREAASF
ncbi:genetic interactor of prohibitins 3 [Microdochium nivale]|nr:genetic interactor of prohibitins 3 [Microdochium nivale]